MRLDARSGVRGLLVDMDSGRPIRFVRWAEVPEDPGQPGEYEAFRSDPEAAKRQGIAPGSLVYRGCCRLRFVPAAPLTRPRASDPRDLAGSLDEARRRVDTRLLIPAEKCDEPGCYRRADWRVSWEQLIEPETDAAGIRHERAVTIRVTSWCHAHYRPPVVRDLRGVEHEVALEGARPQW